MKPTFKHDKARLFHSGNLEVLRELPDNFVHAIVTDPPYGISFMGRKWDYDIPSVDVWKECLRVLRPGGYLLAFASARTQHRMACRIEDAGFEIRDMIAWVYASGFPKSLDVSKAIDKAAGAEREVVGTKMGLPGYSLTDGKGGLYGDGIGANGKGSAECAVTAPATDAAKQWDGWGTTLKPAMEPITVARKVLDGTVAKNVQKWGCGALNIDACRVPSSSPIPVNRLASWSGFGQEKCPEYVQEVNTKGRWPANFIHDGSEEVLQLFPVTDAAKAANRGLQHSGRHGGLADIGENLKEGTDTVRGHDDSGGSAARFFFCAKASREERNAGCGEHENKHPTVKPVALMRHLCKLVTPPNGIILDHYMGSGTTGYAAVTDGFRFIGIEKEGDSFQTSLRRVQLAIEVSSQFLF